MSLLTLTEAGRRMGRSRWTVRAYIDRGVIPFAVEVGRGRYAVPAAALERWLETGDAMEAMNRALDRGTAMPQAPVSPRPCRHRFLRATG